MNAQQRAQACMKNAEQCRAEARGYAGTGAGGDWMAAEKLAEARDWDARAADLRRQCRGKFDPTPRLFADPCATKCQKCGRPWCARDCDEI